MCSHHVLCGFVVISPYCVFPLFCFGLFLASNMMFSCRAVFWSWSFLCSCVLKCSCNTRKSNTRLNTTRKDNRVRTQEQQEQAENIANKKSNNNNTTTTITTKRDEKTNNTRTTMQHNKTTNNKAYCVKAWPWPWPWKRTVSKHDPDHDHPWTPT
jgi:hypothetical protein